MAMVRTSAANVEIYTPQRKAKYFFSNAVYAAALDEVCKDGI